MQCDLVFKSYKIEKIEFVTTEDSKRAEYELNHEYSVEIAKADNNRDFSIRINFNVDDDEKKEKPFELAVSITGEFEYIGGKENGIDDFVVNAVSILYPYLRSCISNITLNANFPALILPMINLMEIFDK